MYRVDLRIQARAQGMIARQRIFLHGEEREILQLTAQQRSAAMAVSFESAAGRLQQLPRMFIEPDGAFVWVARQHEAPWQLEGCLYDRGDRLMYVDVIGRCPVERFDQLLSAFGWPRVELVFQLRRDAVYLDEPALRALAAASDKPP